MSAPYSDPILPGATLGVLGGGQLGRMFALAARRLGYRVVVFAPEADPPAAPVADRHVRAPFDDLDAVAEFAQSVAVVTFEFENVPTATAEAAARHALIRPAGEVLHTTQDRLREKRKLRGLGLPVAEFAEIENRSDLAVAQQLIPGASVLKSAAWGYDGKGQCRVRRATDLEAAWKDLGQQRAVLEELIPFERELSVVGARGVDGEIALYEPFENIHANHVLDVTTVPARLSAATVETSQDIARQVLEGLGVVGVLCVEMFVLPNGQLVVNELAPRPHNSGHVTIDVHQTSQFEQQVRAVCGLPLGGVERRAPAAAMVNLLGELWAAGEPNWAGALAELDVHLHLYGKGEARPGRKMGHLSLIGESRDAVEARGLGCRELLRRTSPGERS